MNSPFHAAIELVRTVDSNVFVFLNRFADSWLITRIASFEEGNNLLKGGLALAVYASLWFRADRDREDTRRAIITIFAGTFLALLASRTVADLAPFRVRPLFEPSLLKHPFAIGVSRNMENWSSFPSDTAAYFSALAFGIWQLKRKYSLLLVLYTAVWICLPRMFLGEHYLSDILMGAAIGIMSVIATLNIDLVRSKFASQVLSWRAAKPSLFYATSFLLCYEMAVLFDDVRMAARGMLAIVARHHESHLMVFLSIAVLGVMGLVIGAASVVHRHHHHATS